MEEEEEIGVRCAQCDDALIDPHVSEAGATGASDAAHTLRLYEAPEGRKLEIPVPCD